MKQKICIVTGTRADFGIYNPLLNKLRKERSYELQIIATGNHFSKKHGETYREILASGFIINKSVPLQLKKNTSADIVSAAADALKGTGKALAELQPDLVILLGDRYEMLSAAIAAHLLHIPVAHLHGGELTEGSLDDAMRHAITQLSSLHFTTTESYRNRVIQMGAAPSLVFNTGSLGVENCLTLKKKSRKQLEEELDISLKMPLALITLHPATNESVSTSEQVSILLNALEQFPQMQQVITYPNADEGYEIIIDAIERYAIEHNHVRVVKSLGMMNYLSLLKYTDVVIGNSSSGIIEVPSFGIPTVNIGERQKSRIAASSVIHVSAVEVEIVQAVNKALTPEFRRKCAEVENPYGDGTASVRIMSVLKGIKDFHTIEKKFHTHKIKL